MAAVYPKCLEQMWQGGINAAAGTVKIQAVNVGYVYSAAHQYASSFTGFTEGSPVTLGTKTFVGGVFTAAPASVTVPLADVVTGFVIYIDTGSAATSPLLVFHDKLADSTPVDFAGTVAAFTVSWPFNYIASI